MGTERTYYTAESLERVLLSFERRYGMPSAEFYEARASDHASLEHVPLFHRHVWASMYRDYSRLSGRDFATHAERVLAGR